MKKIIYIKGNHTGLIQELPDDVANQIIQNGMAAEFFDHAGRGGESEPKPEGNQTKPEIPKAEAGPEAPAPDPRLIAWLESKGFSRRPDGACWTKTERLGTGEIVQLKVDFKNTEKGARYGYRLNEETGGWKQDPNLRDHPLLLEFKRYRDGLLAEEKTQKPEEGKPSEREIPAGQGQALMLKMDERDEQQIVAELQGDFKSEVLKQYFYSFQQGGREIVGLSYKGVKQIALKQGNITLKDLELRETEKGWIAVVKARHETRNLEVYGAAWQPKVARWGEDLFALQKAVSKAQRNALRALIPETIITEAYRAWRERREEWFGG